MDANTVEILRNYADSLPHEDVRFLHSRLEQAYAGDLQEAIGVLEADEEVWGLMQAAKDSAAFNRLLDEVSKAIRAEHRKRLRAYRGR